MYRTGKIKTSNGKDMNYIEMIDAKIAEDSVLSNEDVSKVIANEEKRQAEDVMVSHPAHYNKGKIECIDMLEEFCIGKDPKLAYLIATAIKYLYRVGDKKELGMTIREKSIQDIKKSIWYLERAIKNLEKEKYFKS